MPRKFSGVDALKEHIHHPLTRVRRDVTQLLATTPGGAAHLAKPLQDEDAVVRKRAADGLRRHGVPAQLPLVAAILRDPNSDVRTAACKAAHALGANNPN